MRTVEELLEGMYANVSTQELHALICHVVKDEEQAQTIWHYVANCMQGEMLRGYSSGKEVTTRLYEKKLAELRVKITEGAR